MENVVDMNVSLNETIENAISKIGSYTHNVPTEVLDKVGVLIMVLDIEGKIVYFNRACERASGYKFSEVKGKCLCELLVRQEDMEELKQLFDKILSGRQSDPVIDEYYWVSKSGSERLIAWSNVELTENDESENYIIATGIDVTDTRMAEERLNYLAYYDTVTDLPNRMLFYDKLGHMLGHARRNGMKFALFFIDIDRFKNINDSIGHDAGDMLLKKTASVLSSILRNTDTVARMSGDEFALILPTIAGIGDAANIAKKITGAFKTPIQIDGSECLITLSIGICMYPADGDDVDTLIKHSDIAMYKAKGAGGNVFQFFNKDMNTLVTKRFQMENNLRQAIEKNEFTLYYQPKVDLISGKLQGCEALIRWIKPEGIISPSDFIPLAEETDMINTIGEWALESACRQGRAWYDIGHQNFTMAVNLSARQFGTRDIFKTIKDILARTGLPPECLELELTETILMNEAKSSIETIHKLKGLGVKIALDDFGTGYSSLSYLRNFPIDRLKIDKSFINDIVTDNVNRSITSAIITMAHALEIKVTAEGVETTQQKEFLRHMRCDEAQGYLFSRPVPKHEFNGLFFRVW